MKNNQEINGKLASVAQDSSIGGLGGFMLGLYANAFISTDTHLYPLIGIISGMVVGILLSLRKYNMKHSAEER